MLMFWIVAGLFLSGALLFLVPALLRPRLAGSSAGEVSLLVHRAQWREAEADLAAGVIDAAQAREVRAEIERGVLAELPPSGPASDPAGLPPQLLPSRSTALIVALLIPLASILTYLQLGRPDLVTPELRPAAAAPAAGTGSPSGAGPGGGNRHAMTPEQIQQMAAGLAERLKAQPGDAEGWLMLARSYTALSRFRDAAGAFRKAIDLLPPNPNLLADLADVTGMAQGKRLAGEPARLVQAALDLDPRHVKALALAGSVAFETRDYAAARGYWERLVAVLPPEAPMLRGVRGSIAEATRLETGAPATAAAAPPSADALQRAPQAATPAAIQAGAQGAPGVARVPTATTNATVDAGHAVRGEVTLSPALTARLAPEDTLFVVARAETGPRMPLAVHRVRVGSAATRFAFTLDDSLAMAPNAKLSAHSRVVVSARISRTGEATPRAGDLLSDSTLVAPGSQGLKLVIDRVQP